MNEEMLKQIGVNIRQARANAGRMTIRDLAGIVNSNFSTIQRVESGKTSCRIDLLIDICRALNQPLTTIIPNGGETWQSM